MAARLGDWDVGDRPRPTRRRRLAEEFARARSGRPRPTRAIALVAAMRGDEQTAERLAARAEAGRGAARARTSRWRSPSSARCWPRSRRPPRRRVRIRRAPVRPGRLGLPPGDLLLADRGSRRGRAARRPSSTRRARGWRRSRRVSGDRPGTWIALGLRHARALRGGARREAGERFDEALGERPDAVAVPARPAPARIRPVAATSAAGRRVPRRPARRAGHLRRARVRAVGRAGATRAARIGRAQPAARSRGPRPADRAGAADRPARGRRAVQPRDRPAAVPLAPHGQHAPVPGVPEARHHVARRADAALAPVPAPRARRVRT